METRQKSLLFGRALMQNGHPADRLADIRSEIKRLEAEEAQKIFPGGFFEYFGYPATVG